MCTTSHLTLSTNTLDAAVQTLQLHTLKSACSPRSCYATAKKGPIILCDCCDAEYHTGCLSPPLAAAPEDLWQCPRCQERLAAGVRLHSHALEEAAKARAESGAGDVLRHSVTLMNVVMVHGAYIIFVSSGS
eukprot:4199-Heterococcus_DN1.PRE.3